MQLIKKAMNPDVGSATILGKLYNLRQQQHESIDDFTYKLNNTAQKLRCKAAELDNHKIEAFVKGLKSDTIKLEIVRELA